MNCDSRVRSPEETDAGNHHTNLRKQYISNHFSMLGKDNRSSDRAIDCHLNNGMLDKVSLSLSLSLKKRLLSGTNRHAIICSVPVTANKKRLSGYGAPEVVFSVLLPQTDNSK